MYEPTQAMRKRRRRAKEFGVFLATILAIVLLTPATAWAQEQSLNTQWIAGNGQPGIMFDIVAKTPIRLSRVTQNIETGFSGSVEIYWRPGSFETHENSSIGWTKLNTVPVTSVGTNQPTPIGIDLSSIVMAPNDRVALYITLTVSGTGGGPILYTNGTGVGTLRHQNADVQIFEGTGKNYPFSNNYEHRIWNGTLYYYAAGCVINGVPYANGAPDPGNPCRYCNSSTPGAWSNRASGYNCKSDGLSCTNQVCNGSGVCNQTVTTGCLIGGACVAENIVDPGNSCKVCLPGSSISVYSNLPVNTACATDGHGCTANLCNGTGNCMHPVVTGCFIDEACVPKGTWDPSDSCKACIGEDSRTSYSVKPVGSECADDGNLWTDNVCDQSHTCTHPPNGQCEIGGELLANLTPNDGNECEWCNAHVNPTGWTPKPAGESCTDEGLPCTVDACDGSGACGHLLDSGWCVIGNACVAEETPESGDSCRVCLSGVSTTGYTNRLYGTACATDNRECTNDICNGNGNCTHPIVAGCLIDDVCMEDGAWDPLNSCMECNPALSRTEYSQRETGSECEDDGVLWTLNECNNAGVCTHEPSGKCAIDGALVDNGAFNGVNACEICDSSVSPTEWTAQPSGTPCPNDGPGWTVASCDGDGTCINEPTGLCEIDGALYYSGTTNPENFCEWCNPSATASSWSPKNKGTACFDDGLTCTVDICDGVGQCEHVVAEGCLIEGVCFADREADSTNDCIECNTRYRTDGFSPKADGESCDDGGASGVAGGACDGSGQCWARPAGTCTVDGVAYANGDINPHNDCQRCDSTVDPDGWVSRAKGAACADDGFTCTNNACDGAGTCSTKVVFGCLVDERCVIEGARDSENACMECNPAISTTSYASSPKGTVCDDDEEPGTQDMCDGMGTCTHELKTHCVIGGKMIDAGSVNPDDECRWCDPKAASTAWTDRPNGSLCTSDLLTCTVDVCFAGVCGHNLVEGCLIEGRCVGTGGVPLGVDCMECNPEYPGDYSPKKPGEVCSSLDGNPSTLNICDDEGICTRQEKGTCIIAGKNWPEGASNPANECEWCSPKASSNSWSPKAEGFHCATDHLPCTVDACDMDGVCGHSLMAGNCVIGEECMGKGAQNPTEPCWVCEPEESTTEYIWSDILECNPCKSNADCKPGETCEAGECVVIPPPECSTSNPCPAGKKCEDGVCVEIPTPLGCVVDEECLMGEKCENGKCVLKPISTGCLEDDDCPIGERCENGECKQPTPASCQTDDECLPGQMCENGQCKGIPPEPTRCSKDDQCNGGVCVDGKCQEAGLEGGGCDCGVVGSGAGSSAGGASAALLAMLGLMTGWARRRRAS